MTQFDADSLVFTLPDSWGDVSLSQYLSLLSMGSDKLEKLSILSGLPVDAFRGLCCPTLFPDTANHLAFLLDMPDFNALPVPRSVVLNGKSLSGVKDLAGVTVGQVFDASQALSQAFRANPAREGYTLPEVAMALLGIYLAPIYHSKPFANAGQIAELKPYLLALPVTTALPLAGFYLNYTLSPPSSGRVKIIQMLPKNKPQTGWHRFSGQVLSSVFGNRP